MSSAWHLKWLSVAPLPPDHNFALHNLMSNQRSLTEWRRRPWQESTRPSGLNSPGLSLDWFVRTCDFATEKNTSRLGYVLKLWYEPHVVKLCELILSVPEKCKPRPRHHSGRGLICVNAHGCAREAAWSDCCHPKEARAITVFLKRHPVTFHHYLIRSFVLVYYLKINLDEL